MDIKALLEQFATHPGVTALQQTLRQESVRNLYLSGLTGSAAALTMASLFSKGQTSLLCVLNDLEEAGYFYHDLCQLTGGDQICFFPSAYRRDIKYGHIDSANEILRTEALNLLQEPDRPFMLVSYPEALAERVVSQAVLQQNTLRIHQGDRLDHQFVCDVLHSYGFQSVDYVYEPGQFAIRGSIIDVFSYSYEFPYRIDFFGDEIESIRSFNVETQLSKEKLETIYIVPEMRNDSQKSASLLASLPDSTLLVTRDLAWCKERIGAIWNEEPVQADENEVEEVITPQLAPQSQPIANKEKVSVKKPNKVKLLSVVNKKEKKIKATWKRDKTASGYELVYSQKRSFKNAKRVIVKSNKTVSTTIKKLKKGKTYYVKVRAYKKVNGKKIYGSYSSAKKVIVKK